ncbi:DUF5983 family protein [Bacillus sp. FSL K6-6540]|uniref:DUF5983 family protein n=1 Tax=Bacillus sp. FSL K6-6540 TaxID=2921512 RepID=UPI0030FCC971
MATKKNLSYLRQQSKKKEEVHTMVLRCGDIIVCEWNNKKVQGIDQKGRSFSSSTCIDPEGSLYFNLNGQRLYEKYFSQENVAINKVLNLSLGHVSKETVEYLRTQAQELFDIELVVYEKGEHGFMIFVDPEDKKLPEDLMQVIEYASLLGCAWIMLDSNGTINQNLPWYEWQ